MRATRIADFPLRPTPTNPCSENFEASAANGPTFRDCSLVVTEEVGGEMRFRMLELVREHAATYLAPEERMEVQRRHCHWYLAEAELVERREGDLRDVDGCPVDAADRRAAALRARRQDAAHLKTASLSATFTLLDDDITSLAAEGRGLKGAAGRGALLSSQRR